jgi:hypothetical protein
MPPDPQGAEALIRRLREASNRETPEYLDWDTPPEVSWEELGGLSDLMAEAADALAALSGGARPQEGSTFTENETKDVLTALYQDGHVDLVLADRIAALMRESTGRLEATGARPQEDDRDLPSAAEVLGILKPDVEAAGARPPEPAQLAEAMVKAATETWKDAAQDRAAMERDIEEALKAEEGNTHVAD